MVNIDDIIKMVEASDASDKTNTEDAARRQNFCDSCTEKGNLDWIDVCMVDKQYTILKTSFVNVPCPLAKWSV